MAETASTISFVFGDRNDVVDVNDEDTFLEFGSTFCNIFDIPCVNADHFLLCHHHDPSVHFAPSGILPDTPSFNPTDGRPCSAGVSKLTKEDKMILEDARSHELTIVELNCACSIDHLFASYLSHLLLKYIIQPISQHGAMVYLRYRLVRCDRHFPIWL